MAARARRFLRAHSAELIQTMQCGACEVALEVGKTGPSYFAESSVASSVTPTMFGARCKKAQAMR